MNISNMKNILTVAHQSSNAVHMIGEAGIGKTEIVKAYGKEQGFHVEVLQLTVMDTGDLMGMPIIDTDEFGDKITTWAKPVWLQRLHRANAAGKHCIVFLDELGRASIDIRQAALQMVLENKIQEHSLGEFEGLPSLIVVADNPADEYDSEDFDAALEDRFMTFDVETSLEGFLEYARAAKVIPVVTDYLAEHPEMLLFKPKDTSEKRSTPRAWEALSRALKILPDTSPVTYSIILSKVGKTVGLSFNNFLKNYSNIVSVKDILKLLDGAKTKTEKQQKAARELLKSTTQLIEPVSAGELAEKLLADHKSDKKTGVNAEVILAYISSLDTEIAAGILKTWKLNDNKDFYIEEFSVAQGDGRWYANELRDNIKK